MISFKEMSSLDDQINYILFDCLFLNYSIRKFNTKFRFNKIDSFFIKNIIRDLAMNRNLG